MATKLQFKVEIEYNPDRSNQATTADLKMVEFALQHAIGQTLSSNGFAMYGINVKNTGAENYPESTPKTNPDKPEGKAPGK